MSESLSERLLVLRAADGTRLTMTELGPSPSRSGPTFLLVHGLGQNRSAFRLGPLPAELLARGGRVFLGELRGHGHSRHGNRVHTLDDHLRHDLPTFLNALPSGPVHFIGHSLGGLLGYAALAEPYADRLGSLTGIAAPLGLGASRPDVRWLAQLALVVAPRLDRVPLDRLLIALAGPLAHPEGPFWLRGLQRYVGLSNPALAAPAALRAALQASHSEPTGVFQPLLQMAATGAPVLLGRDLAALTRASALPIAAVVGGRDLFASPRSMAGFLDSGAGGPRHLETIEKGAHVDLVLGHHWSQTLNRLWPFWFQR